MPLGEEHKLFQCRLPQPENQEDNEGQCSFHIFFSMNEDEELAIYAPKYNIGADDPWEGEEKLLPPIYF